MPNRHNPMMLEFAGATQTVEQWAEEYELPASTIYKRLRKGWNAFEAISTPPMPGEFVRCNHEERTSHYGFFNGATL